MLIPSNPVTRVTYNEQLADYVYSRLPEAVRRFRAVLAVTATQGE